VLRKTGTVKKEQGLDFYFQPLKNHG